MSPSRYGCLATAAVFVGLIFCFDAAAAAAGGSTCDALHAFLVAQTGVNSSAMPLTAGVNSPGYFPTWFNVTEYQQETNWTCGPASLHSTLLAFGYDVSEDELASEMGTNSDIGTNISRMQAAASARNLSATLVQRATLLDLRFALSNGQLVIVLYQAWADEPATPYINVWDSGHFSVLFGMDDQNVYLMDPWTGRFGYIPTQYFVYARWHAPDEYGDYGICVRCALLVGPLGTRTPPKILVQQSMPKDLIFVN